MIDPKTLLKDLQTLVKDLEADLLERAEEDSDVDRQLRDAYVPFAREKRTAQAFEVWRTDYLTQVAVAWVLGCVFVRYLEDNDLVDECWLSGTGDRTRLSDDTHRQYFQENPHDSDRDYFLHVFRQVGQIRAAQDLFAEGKTPIWALGPSGDGAMRLWAFWREIDSDTGELRRSFKVESGETRFLGDLYQELSETAKKKYALLQTPEFVEEFILDRTLDPAIDEFGLEEVRMIDPTCGSGHFLLGAFDRLFDLWSKREPGTAPEVLAQRALSAVHGVDINPYAVAIARFRLIVEALVACGMKRIKDAPAWKINVAAGDSLLHGSHWDRAGNKIARQTLFDPEWVDDVYAVEEPKEVARILGQQYHAVVGNPPYITVKDKAQADAYRELYSTCHSKFSLGVPFTERFFDIASSPGERNSGVGFIGLITTNSFMRREFGAKLIQDFFPTVDLTHIIDTSGAYIPGHGTPTVILLGRNQNPISLEIRGALGIRGEPSTPDDPSNGLVWRSIVDHLDLPGRETDFITIADLERSRLASHPWTISGGGALELKERIERDSKESLGSFVQSIGPACFPGIDDIFVLPEATLTRATVEPDYIYTFVTGEEIRDWKQEEADSALVPYDQPGELIEIDEEANWYRHLWLYKTTSENVVSFNKQTRKQIGEPWWSWYRWISERVKASSKIVFAFIATHNHFVLDRGGKVFNRSAPIIKLPEGATEEDHLALLGLLNSSVACFWMKQVFYPKATSTGDISTDKGKPEANRYEFAGTGMEAYPIPNTVSSGSSLILRIATALDTLSGELSESRPESVIRRWDEMGRSESLGNILSVAENDHSRIHKRMIALQEELDWECYKAYGLSVEGANREILGDTESGISPDLRPFAWTSIKPPSGIPASWLPIYQKRKDLTSKTKELILLEDIVFKRPWWGRQGVYGRLATDYAGWKEEALESWLFDRLETERYLPHKTEKPELVSCAKLSDIAAADSEFLQVAALYKKREDFDRLVLVTELMQSEAVPFLPVLRYKKPGLVKRKVWERTWDLQRKEDAGKDVGDIPVPPKYTSTDFLKSDYWRLRGKLDVPKERFISYPGAERDGDPTLVVAWAGWNHLQQAQALSNYYIRMKENEGWEPGRLTPLLAGLDQLVPWLKQWHNEYDPALGVNMGDFVESFVGDEAHSLGLTLEQVRKWEPPKKAGKKKRQRGVETPR